MNEYDYQSCAEESLKPYTVKGQTIIVQVAHTNAAEYFCRKEKDGVIHRLCKPAGRHGSSYRAETVALHAAPDWIVTHHTERQAPSTCSRTQGP